MKHNQKINPLEVVEFIREYQPVSFNDMLIFLDKYDILEQSKKNFITKIQKKEYGLNIKKVMIGGLAHLKMKE